MEDTGRDLTWDAIVTVAVRLEGRAVDQGLAAAAVRRRAWRRMKVIEGIHCGDLSTDVFEPVRQRCVFGGKWVEIQPAANAASNIGTFLRDRPDLSGSS